MHFPATNKFLMTAPAYNSTHPEMESPRSLPSPPPPPPVRPLSRGDCASANGNIFWPLFSIFIRSCAARGRSSPRNRKTVCTRIFTRTGSIYRRWKYPRNRERHPVARFIAIKRDKSRDRDTSTGVKFFHHLFGTENKIARKASGIAYRFAETSRSLEIGQIGRRELASARVKRSLEKCLLPQLCRQ